MSWLESITEGSQVIVDPGHGLNLRLYKVDRLTKTQIIIGTWRFRRSDGRGVGSDSWHFLQLLEPKPPLIERIRRDRLITYITNSKDSLNRLPLEMLDAFALQLKSVADAGTINAPGQPGRPRRDVPAPRRGGLVS